MLLASETVGQGLYARIHKPGSWDLAEIWTNISFNPLDFFFSTNILDKPKFSTESFLVCSFRKFFRHIWRPLSYICLLCTWFSPALKKLDKNVMCSFWFYFSCTEQAEKGLKLAQMLHMLGSWWSRKGSQILHHFLMQSLHPEGIHLPAPSSHHEVKLIHELVQSPDTQFFPKGFLMPQNYF